MGERGQATLRVEAHAIPAVREAFDGAIDQLERLLGRAGRGDAYITEPWLGDPISLAVTRLYNDRFIVGPESAQVQVFRYRDELVRVRDALAEMEDRYRRTEGENAELWGRLA